MSDVALNVSNIEHHFSVFVLGDMLSYFSMWESFL